MAESRAQTQRKKTTVREVEENLGSKIDELEQKIDKSVADLLEAIRLLRTQSGGVIQSNQANPVGSNSESNHQNGSGNTLNYSGVIRLPKPDFPRFNGDKVNEWLLMVEQFFDIDRTPWDLKVGLASMHFEDIAATWHRSLVQSEFAVSGVLDWPGYVILIKERFAEVWDDPTAQLKELKETEGIVDYHRKFELISTQVQLPEEDLADTYLAGLRSDTQMNIRMFQPQSVSQCFMLGRLYEQAYPKQQSALNWSTSKYTNEVKRSSQVKKEETMAMEEDTDYDSFKEEDAMEATEGKLAQISLNAMSLCNMDGLLFEGHNVQHIQGSLACATSGEDGHVQRSDDEVISRVTCKFDSSYCCSYRVVAWSYTWNFANSDWQQLRDKKQRTSYKTWIFKCQAKRRKVQSLKLTSRYSFLQKSYFVWHRWRSKTSNSCGTEHMKNWSKLQTLWSRFSKQGGFVIGKSMVVIEPRVGL